VRVLSGGKLKRGLMYFDIVCGEFIMAGAFSMGIFVRRSGYRSDGTCSKDAEEAVADSCGGRAGRVSC